MKRLIRLSATLFAASLLSNCDAGVDTDRPAADVSDATIVTTPAIGAYLIVQGKNYEPAALGPYAASLPPIYEKYGGRYVSFETDIDVAEGDSDYSALIMSAWPSKAAARAFWNSPEYAEAIKLREGIGEFDVVIVGALPERE